MIPDEPIRTHRQEEEEQPAPGIAPPDPVEGRSDAELWKRHRPKSYAPARSGGDEDVEGSADQYTMKEYDAALDHRPAPGLLDTTPDADTVEPQETKSS